jgi:hypothetical protein
MKQQENVYQRMPHVSGGKLMPKMLREVVSARTDRVLQVCQETAPHTAAQKTYVIPKVQLVVAVVAVAAVAAVAILAIPVTPATPAKEVHHLLSNAQKTARYT